MCICFLLLPYCVLRALHSFPTRRSSDLEGGRRAGGPAAGAGGGAGARGGVAPLYTRTRCLYTLAARMAELDRRSEEHTSELQSQFHLVCRLLLEKKNFAYMLSKSRVCPG